jgi:polysaccharide pyruvyl transferase WcaK-like protein
VIRDTGMSTNSTKPLIGILAHVGNDNLGDEATVAALIQNLQKRLPGVGLVAFSTRPEHTRKVHGIPAYPLRRSNSPVSAHTQEASSGPTQESKRAQQQGPGHSVKAWLKKIPAVFNALKSIQVALQQVVGTISEAGFLFQSYRRIRGVKVLIVGGSQQLNDIVQGPWAFPYTVFKWSVLARLAGAKIAFASVGAGPIDTFMGRFFIKRALFLGSYRGFRDIHAQRFATGIGFDGEAFVVPDLVYSLSLSSTQKSARGVRPRVAINPLPLYDGRYWPVSDPERYRSYLQTLSQFVLWLIGRGYDVVLFPTQLKADPLTIDDLMADILSRGGPESASHIEVPACHSLQDVVSVVRGADMIAATRYHGVVFSLLCNKPVLALAYHAKTQGLMALVGLEDYVVGADPLQYNPLQDRFMALEANQQRITSELGARVDSRRAEVELQYDRILSLLPAKSSLASAETLAPLAATGPREHSQVGGSR